MNAHTTIATDNFNRADASNLGGNWTNGVFGGSPGVVSNQASNRTGSVNLDAFRSAENFNADQYVSAKLVQFNTGSNDFSGIQVRASATDYVSFGIDLSLGRVQIQWYNGGSFTVLANDGGSTGNPVGKVFTLEVIGSTYYGYLDGVLVLTATNVSTPATGKPGIKLAGTNADQSLWDDWEGGNIGTSQTKTFTVDGIVKATATTTLTTDGIITSGKTKTFTTDGIIKATNTKTFTVDGIVSDGTVEVLGADDLILELMAVTPVGTISGNASYITPSYTRLTPNTTSQHGAIDYTLSIPSVFIFEADFYALGSADANWIYYGQSSIPVSEEGVGNGYIIALDEFSGDDHRIQLWYNGVRLASADFPFDVGDGVKRTVKVVKDGSHFYIYVNKVLCIDYIDTVTRTYDGNHIGVGARTGGATAEHRCYRIHAYTFTSLFHPTPTLGGLSTLPFRVIDVMKWTKDLINLQPNASQISAIIKTIADNFNVTHIAIAVPLNIDQDYLDVGIIPSPASVQTFTQLWCSAIHNAGLKVLFRGAFNELEKSGSTGNWNAIMKVGINRLPAGTPTSALTDDQTTWLGKLRSLIITNPTWFADGDIFAPMPERTENNTSFVTISSITRVGTTATITTSGNHNVGNQQPIGIFGATQSAYNGSFIATVISDTQFTIQVVGTPVTPATGTMHLQFGDSLFSDENAWLPNTGAGVNNNYADFFENVITVANSAFSSINKSVKTGYTTNNFSEVFSGFIPQGLYDASGRVAVDHYGITHSAIEMYNDLVGIFVSRGHIIDHQEWADYWNGSVDTTTRTDYLVNFYNMLTQLFEDGVYDMLNYWGGWVGGLGEGILTDLSSGGTYKYGITAFGSILAQFFNVPVVTPVAGTVSGFFLDGIQLKNPKAFVPDYVYAKTDYTMLTGQTKRDISGLKEKYLLTFENLTMDQVTALETIIDKEIPVSFSVYGRGQVTINTTVWPYIGAIVYSTVGSDYRASLQLELIEEE